MLSAARRRAVSVPSAAAARTRLLRPPARQAPTPRFASTVPSADAFRRFGHLEAHLDPLGLSVPTPRPELAGADAEEGSDVLRRVYCGALGAEFEHLEAPEERAWWAARLEAELGPASGGGFQLTFAQKRNAWALLEQAEQFELFLARKYVSFKRYSGEGTESLLPCLNEVFAAAAGAGVRDVVVGMAHRGRLALLVSLLGYPPRQLLWKIGGNDDFPAGVQGLDDVSSHVAASVDRVYGAGAAARSVHVSLLHNPSHLEYVNPVAAGKARAKQDQGSDDALCLLVHGDAAVSGQVRGRGRGGGGGAMRIMLTATRGSHAGQLLPMSCPALYAADTDPSPPP